MSVKFKQSSHFASVPFGVHAISKCERFLLEASFSVRGAPFCREKGKTTPNDMGIVPSLNPGRPLMRAGGKSSQQSTHLCLENEQRACALVTAVGPAALLCRVRRECEPPSSCARRPRAPRVQLAGAARPCRNGSVWGPPAAAQPGRPVPWGSSPGQWRSKQPREGGFGR